MVVPTPHLSSASLPLIGLPLGASAYASCVLLVEFILIGAFIVTDLVSFYVLFEAVLMPMWLLIVQYGSSSIRVRASMLFFLYTLSGSMSMLLSIGYLYVTTGTGDYLLLSHSSIDYDAQQ